MKQSFTMCLRRYRHSLCRLMEMIAMRLTIYKPKSDKDIRLEMSHNHHDWKNCLKVGTRILVFDTETTGVDAANDYILSLSWQVLDSKLHKTDEQTRYFKSPLPDDAIKGALRVNGLTEDVLEKLGTTDKRKVLEEFVEVAKSCDLLVGHNVRFDIAIVSSECKRVGLDFGINFLPFDTMKDMRTFCLYYHTPRVCKWPKLIELTEMLGIDTSDINWHMSSSDVEATVRCLREIATKGYARSPWNKLIMYHSKK